MSTHHSFSSVQSLSCVRFFATRPHGLQQARLPCPLPVSGSSAFSKPSLNIWKILNHVLLKFIPPEIKHTMQPRELKLQDYVRIENRSVAYTRVNTEFLIFSKCPPPSIPFSPCFLSLPSLFLSHFILDCPNWTGKSRNHSIFLPSLVLNSAFILIANVLFPRGTPLFTGCGSLLWRMSSSLLL